MGTRAAAGAVAVIGYPPGRAETGRPGQPRPARSCRCRRRPATRARTAARRWPRSVAVKESHAAGWLADQNGGNVRIGPGGSWCLFFWAFRWARRFGGVARSIAEGLAGAASALAQRRPGIGHPAAGCLYPQITAEKERAALDGADGGRDVRLLTGNTRGPVVQGPGRAAADYLGYQRRARGVRGDPGPLPAIEYLRKPSEALGGTCRNADIAARRSTQ
jgi:hypothetical protein